MLNSNESNAITTNFAKQLRSRREAKGLSVRGLGRKSGVSASTISGIETGRRKNILFPTAIILASNLKTDVYKMCCTLDEGVP